MKRLALMTFFIAAESASTIAFAQSSTFEGTAVVAGASMNPPNPIEGCNKAKDDAYNKAAKSGFQGAASWERLSVDSDCKLTTQAAGKLGYYFIFTARGKFGR